MAKTRRLTLTENHLEETIRLELDGRTVCNTSYDESGGAGRGIVEDVYEFLKTEFPEWKAEHIED